jgi:hypothetical protein
MAHACNPHYSGSGDQKGHSQEASPGKKFREPILTNKLGVVL